ncbi:MAG: hypothetical protein LBJ95_03220 [Oscillospiraceae bacterium]|jgi:hypothetical protein|nr:hypothetical protein [Oscillospiraceae bacterium]
MKKHEENSTKTEARWIKERNLTLQPIDEDTLGDVQGGAHRTETHYGIEFTCTGTLDKSLYYWWTCGRCQRNVLGNELGNHAIDHLQGKI